VFVQDRQQGCGPLASGLGQAAEFGNAGGALAEDDLQEASGDGQTDASGLGSAGELGLAVLVEDNGVVETPLQVVAAGQGMLELLAEEEVLLTVGLCVEVVADGVGLAVDGLSAESVFVGDA
jgi:hypothetical protein